MNDGGRFRQLPWPSWQLADRSQEWLEDDLADLVRQQVSSIVIGHALTEPSLSRVGLAVVDKLDGEIHTTVFATDEGPSYSIVIDRGLVEFLRDCMALCSGGDEFSSVPEDRSDYAHHLFGLGLGFIVECELSRILSGHLRYAEEQGWRIGCLGVGSPPAVVPPAAALTIGTLQWDADCTAMARQTLWALNVSRGMPVDLKQRAGRFRSPAMVWFDQLVAMSLFFREQDARIPAELWRQSSCLSPLLRLDSSQMVMATVCTEYGIESLGEFDFGTDKLTMDSLREMAYTHGVPTTDVQVGALAARADQFAQECLRAAGRPVQPLDPAVYHKLVDEYRAHWAMLHPALEPYMHVPLAAADGHDPDASTRKIVPADAEAALPFRLDAARSLLNLDDALLSKAHQRFTPIASAIEETRRSARTCSTEGCGERSIQCHTIGEQSQLAQIADSNGHVSWIPMRPRDTVAMVGSILREQPTRSTLTFRGFCADCDESLFRRIDAPIEVVTPQIAVLLAYRSLAYSIWYAEQELSGRTATDILGGGDAPGQHEPESTNDSTEYKHNSRLLRASELRWAIDNAKFGCLKTTVFELTGEQVDQFRYSCVVPATKTLDGRRTPLVLKDCVTESALFVHVLGLKDGKTVLIVSARTDQPAKALDNFARSILRASKKGLLSSAVLRFVMLSNKGFVTSTTLMNSLRASTLKSLETEVLHSQITGRVSSIEDSYPGMPDWQATRLPNGIVAPKLIDEDLLEIAGKVASFDAQPCRTYLSRWLRACAANRLGLVNIGTARVRVENLLEACRATQLSGTDSNHARVLVLLALAALDEQRQDAWLEKAEACLAADTCALHLGSLADIRVGLIGLSFRHRRSLFSALEESSSGASLALRTFVAAQKVNCLDNAAVQLAETSEANDLATLDLEMAAVLAMAEAHQHRRAGRALETLQAARRAMDHAEALGLKVERVQLVHQRSILHGLWAQTQREDWDEEMSRDWRLVGNLHLGFQYRELSAGTSVLERKLFGRALDEGAFNQ